MDLKLVDYYAPLIADALAKLVTPAQIRAAIEAAASTVAKDAESDAKARIAEIARAKLARDANPGALEQIIRELYYDSYAIGGAAASRQLGLTPAGIDWDTWQPGDAGAAEQAADGGLASLLDSAGVGIKDIVGSALDSLGNAIADGVAAGSNTDDIAASLSEWVTGARAEMIAQTESARAVTSATLATYTANGISEFDWVLSDGACDVCDDLASGGPYLSTDTDNAPPGHPRCRCSASPRGGSVTADLGGDE